MIIFDFNLYSCINIFMHEKDMGFLLKWYPQKKFGYQFNTAYCQINQPNVSNHHNHNHIILFLF